MTDMFSDEASHILSHLCPANLGGSGQIVDNSAAKFDKNGIAHK